MKISTLEWPATLFRVVRDRGYEAIGHVPRDRYHPRAKYLSGRQLGYGCRANGGRAYVAYHGNFFDPQTYLDLGVGGVAWLRSDELPRFVGEVLPLIRGPIVVVTAESDWSMPSSLPDACSAMIRSGKVRRWFASQFDGSAHVEHVTPLPIGLPYGAKHALGCTGRGAGRRFFRWPAPLPANQDVDLDAAISASPPLSGRIPLAFGDFALNNSSRNGRFGESRSDIAAVLRKSGCVVFPEQVLPYEELIAAYCRHAFVVSPHGRGMDCFRTWEALLCGCIVIVKRSPLDVLYEGLPVVIIERWEDVTRSNLQLWLARYGDGFDRARTREVLSLDYWRARIGIGEGT